MNSSADDETNNEHDFVSHNFEAMNRAIDTEVDKRFELNELYRYQQTSRRTLMFLHIAVSLCVIAVSAAVIWWLFHQPTGYQIEHGSIPFTEASTSSAFDRDTSAALSVISEHEQPSQVEQTFINTSFTVFHRTLIPTGEYVVTGKTYQPDNLKSPNEQYCYLEKSQSSSDLTGQPLASINEADFTLETDDSELIGFARKYCQFTK